MQVSPGTENIPKTILLRLKSMPIEYWMPVPRRSFKDLLMAHGIDSYRKGLTGEAAVWVVKKQKRP